MFFGGSQGTVTAATATTLTVRPSVTVDVRTPTLVTVEVANQMSNALAFDLVPQGTPVRLPVALPDRPTGVAYLGATTYVGAAGGPMGGLYAQDATGKVTRLVAPRRLTGAPAGAPAYVEPTALATDGQGVFYATNLGTIHRYDPGTGADTVVFDASLYGAATGLAWADGYLYLVTSESTLIRVGPDGRSAVDHDVTLGGIFGVAAQNGRIYLTIPGSNRVLAVGTPETNPTVLDQADVSPGCTKPQAVVAIGNDDLLVTCNAGTLFQLNDPAVGVSGFGGGTAVQGLGIPTAATQGAFVSAAGSAGAKVLFALPTDGVVASRDQGSLAVTPVLAGLRGQTLGAARVDGHLYLATSTAQTWDLVQPDDTVLDVAPDGSSRLVFVGSSLSGLAPGPGGKLYTAGFSAAGQASILAIDPATGAQTVVTSQATGVYLDVAFDADGNLFATRVGATADTLVLSRIPAGSATETDVSTFPGHSSDIVGIGATGVTVGPSFFGNDGISTVPLDGSPAQQVAPAGALGDAVSALTTADGAILVFTRVDGEILEVDPGSGAVRIHGSSRVIAFDPATSIGAGVVRGVLRADGTLVVADGQQDAVVAVAP